MYTKVIYSGLFQAKPPDYKSQTFFSSFLVCFSSRTGGRKKKVFTLVVKHCNHCNYNI